MHCIIARRRQNGNNSFKISANKSRPAKLEGNKLLKEELKSVWERGGEGRDNRKDARDKKKYFIWLKIIATESESEVEKDTEKEREGVKESA